jgi:hypothetical protein
MQKLPEPLSQQPGEPQHLYAARLFAFVVQHRITATLTDEQLEQAAHAGHAAAAVRDRMPAYYAHVTDTRHQIARALTGRATPPAPDAIPGTPDDRIVPGGRTAPLTPPDDFTPPSGATADPYETPDAIGATSRGFTGAAARGLVF